MKIEPIENVPGTHGGYGQGIIHADYTHSLLGALVIAALFGLVCAIRWRATVGARLGGVVFSHWLLDLPMHRADMPLLPGNAGHLPLLGFGLWRWPVASATWSWRWSCSERLSTAGRRRASLAAATPGAPGS